MNSFGLTDVGRRRTTNQDFVYISETPVGNLPNLFVVADGMGGHNAGDLASRYAVEQFLKSVKENPEENPVSIMEEAAEAANWETYQKAGTDPALFGMGTTLVTASVCEHTLYVGNIGDSRLYLIGDGIRQITRDHSLVEEMVRMGEITADQARVHPDKNIITRAIGVRGRARVDFFEEELRREDIILMCSDGLTNMVTDEEIQGIVKESRDLEDAARKLVAQANESGGRDNIAVVLVKPVMGEVKKC